MKHALPMSLAAAAVFATGSFATVPASANDGIIVDRYRTPVAPNNYTNKWWVDYETDVSEAKRELRSDLRRASDAEDRRDAYEEYYSELADARKDYRKEMRERGYRVASFRANTVKYAMR